LREDLGEVEAAINGKLPKLIEKSDIRGDLHVHSRWSDGAHSLEELVNAAKRRGLSYMALTDHSHGLGIAKGLSVERLMEQKKEVAAMNSRLKGFRILHGTEMDIRSDGTLDFPDEALQELDIVIASIHSGFKQPKEKIMARMKAAMEHPCVSIIAHPTGRILGERDPYEVDMEELLRMAKKTGTALEINTYPLRLDLNDSAARRAGEVGVPLVISTDTHTLSQFETLSYGISVARRAWLEKRHVLNTLEVDKLLERLKHGGGGRKRKGKHK
jgi:DNA polymerase (family 10)